MNNFADISTTLESALSLLSFKISQMKSATIEIPATFTRVYICSSSISRAENIYITLEINSLKLSPIARKIMTITAILIKKTNSLLLFLSSKERKIKTIAIADILIKTVIN